MKTSPILNAHRYLVLLVDIQNGNPQGDPDDDNRPRTDPETGHGLITPQGPKRKIRDRFTRDGLEVYVSRGSCLQRTNRGVADSIGIPDIFGQASSESEDSEDESDEKPVAAPKGKRGGARAPAAPVVKITSDMSQKVYAEVSRRFIDARLFGVLVPKLSGTNRGPIQVSMGRSIDPVSPLRMSITRSASALEKDEQSQGGANRSMGGLWYVPYGLYRFHIYVNPSEAARVGCTEDDYQKFVNAVSTMFDDDQSSVRTSSCVRALYEFTRNPKAEGSVFSEKLMESVRVRRNTNNEGLPARSFNDYTVTMPEAYYRKNEANFTFRRIVSEKPAWEEETAEAAE